MFGIPIELIWGGGFILAMFVLLGRYIQLHNRRDHHHHYDPDDNPFSF